MVGIMDKTWAEFSTLDMAMCVLCIFFAMEKNCLT